MGKAWSLVEKLLIAAVVLAIADKVFNPYQAPVQKSAERPLQIVWSSPKL